MHRLVLDGLAPELATHYPSVGGDGDPAAAWQPFAATVERHVPFLETFVERPVQTNEVGRCRALLGGFLLVAEQGGLPLRLLEVGASAGLNLRWDKYRYEAGGASWGDSSSAVVLRDGFRTDPPFRAGQVAVAAREGCDLSPIDVTVPGEAATLLSYIWADQADRLAALRGALQIAAAVPVQLDAADACEWLAGRAEPHDGVMTVLFHSYVMQLLDPASRRQVAELLEDAGRRATRSSPLAWLQYEYLGGKGTVRLRTWPGGNDVVLARASAHGQNIEWTATSVSAI